MSEITNHNLKTIITTLCFAIALSIVSVLLPTLITMTYWGTNGMLFVVIGCLSWRYFSDVFEKTRQDKTVIALFIVGSRCIHLVTCYVIIHHADTPSRPFEAQGISFLLMNDFFVWIKPLDVIVQHLFIIILIDRLRSYQLTRREILIHMIFGFGLLHLPLVLIHGVVGIGITIVTLLFSLLFPRCIMRYRYGYIYNMLIHLGIYDIIALVLWLAW